MHVIMNQWRVLGIHPVWSRKLTLDIYCRSYPCNNLHGLHNNAATFEFQIFGCYCCGVPPSRTLCFSTEAALGFNDREFVWQTFPIEATPS